MSREVARAPYGGPIPPGNRRRASICCMSGAKSMMMNTAVATQIAMRPAFIAGHTLRTDEGIVNRDDAGRPRSAIFQ
jgi:hypothetical protein